MSMSTTTTTCNSKPHKAHQTAWSLIRALHAEAGEISLNHFKIIRPIGAGDIGKVYLCRIKSSNPEASNVYYAMKVVDKSEVAMKNKLHRCLTEKDILSILDHPFLPTLYAYFDSSNFSCLLMDYCPGGDLYTARFKQPRRRFSLSSAKFYGAETLLAIEYLHILGIVYRDLKPENVLVREDGHIMLTDFDLSFKSEVTPKLEITRKKMCSKVCSSPMQPVFSCFLGGGGGGKTESVLWSSEMVVEPGVGGKARSFVGTHEYLAPEVVRGCGHGSSVDWWTFGVFMYELIYGCTPFRGENNRKTLMNIVGEEVRFPGRSGDGEENGRARDLICRLLVKNPKRRLGSVKGAGEIRRHPFFEDVNWALIRSVKPPEIPSCREGGGRRRRCCGEEEEEEDGEVAFF